MGTGPVSWILFGDGNFDAIDTIPEFFAWSLDSFESLLEIYGVIDFLNPLGVIDPLTWNRFDSAQTWMPPRVDPLALDLDGDGIETVAQGGWDGVLFDQNNDGVKTGTGWLSGDDGFLTLDRNGNGRIDNGTELFGDNTQLSNGETAADGFAALADLDTNQDGTIDANDAEFNDLRVWQDLNQDGISQAEELRTLAELGITGLSTSGTAANQSQNGNVITQTGTFTRSDGTSGVSGNLNLASSTFFTEFDNTVPLSETDLARPDLHGSGAVRNLRQAAASSAELADLLDHYASLTTRGEQQALLAELIDGWAGTSSMPGLLQHAADNGFILNITFGNLGQNTQAINQIDFTGIDPSDSQSVLSTYLGQQSATYQAWIDKLAILERFNGQEFFNFETLNKTQAASITFLNDDGSTDSERTAEFSEYRILNINISQGQLDLLQQSYDALTESVYGGLVKQTRFMTYLDHIGLESVDGSLQLDATPILDSLEQLHTSDPVNALYDLTELYSYGGNLLNEAGIDARAKIVEWLEPFSSDSAVLGQIRNIHPDFLFGNAGNDSITGTAIDDVIIGDQGDDTLIGQDGEDTLLGGSGNDQLHGGNGDDVLNGGAGSDQFWGGAGADRYVFDSVTGWEWIRPSSATSGLEDVIEFSADSGIGADQIRLIRYGNNLDIRVLDANGTFDTQCIVVESFFANYAVKEIRLADGTVLAGSGLLDRITSTQGGDGNDALYGYGGSVNHVFGNGGADYVTGGNLGDVLDGGSGDDRLYGQDGDDSLIGADGNDYLFGGAGNNTFNGGAGSDFLFGNDINSNDTYVFNRGDGRDVIADSSYSGPEYQDTIQFGEGIDTQQLWFSRNNNDLLIDVVGTDDQVRIKDWYSSSNNQIEEITVADQVLFNNQVDNLVNAMAAFNVQTGPGEIIPQEIQEQIAPVIAANWSLNSLRTDTF